MDPTRFDALTRSLARRPTRRVTLRLLAGGLLGGLLPRNGAMLARAAQRPDRDGDQLFDDDEVNEYFTDPDNPDTDGDSASDGLEVWNRDQGLGDPDDPLVPDNPNAPPPPPAGGTDCLTNPDSCTVVGEVDNPAGNVDPTLTCEAQGLTDCAGDCVNTATDNYHCGWCNHWCVSGTSCQAGVCEVSRDCPAGSAFCDVTCTDMQFDDRNCGACGNACASYGHEYDHFTCCHGQCVNIRFDYTNCGGCGIVCPVPDDLLDFYPGCYDYRCET